MLVLSRKTDQRIQIGADVTITVVQLHNGTVKLGIEAPREVKILRSELAQREKEREAQREPRAAAPDREADTKIYAGRLHRSRLAARPLDHVRLAISRLSR